MTMNDVFQSVTHEIDQYALWIALVLAALVFVIFLSRNKIRQSLVSAKTRRQLRHLGLKQVADFRCPDGLGGYFVVDRLLMRHDGISLVMFKRYAGSIYCADNIDEWTQLLGGKSYFFKNPLLDLEYQVNVLSARIPGVDVNGYLLFDHHASFPKGHPDRVFQLDSIPSVLKCDNGKKAQAPVVAAWEKLLSITG